MRILFRFFVLSALRERASYHLAPSPSRLSVATTRSFPASASARRTVPCRSPSRSTRPPPPASVAPAARKIPPLRDRTRRRPSARRRRDPDPSLARARSHAGSRDEHPRRAGSISAGIELSERRREERADERRPPAPPRKRFRLWSSFRPSRPETSRRRSRKSRAVRNDSRLYVQWEPRRAQEDRTEHPERRGDEARPQNRQRACLACERRVVSAVIREEREEKKLREERVRRRFARRARLPSEHDEKGVSGRGDVPDETEQMRPHQRVRPRGERMEGRGLPAALREPTRRHHEPRLRGGGERGDEHDERDVPVRASSPLRVPAEAIQQREPDEASPALANARLERTSRETSCLPCAPTPSTARGVSVTREDDRCDVCTSRDAVTTDAITAFEAGARRNPGGPNPAAQHRTPSAPSSAPPKATSRASSVPLRPLTRFRVRRDEGFRRRAVFTNAFSMFTSDRRQSQSSYGLYFALFIDWY